MSTNTMSTNLTGTNLRCPIADLSFAPGYHQTKHAHHMSYYPIQQNVHNLRTADQKILNDPHLLATKELKSDDIKLLILTSAKILNHTLINEEKLLQLEKQNQFLSNQNQLLFAEFKRQQIIHYNNIKAVKKNNNDQNIHLLNTMNSHIGRMCGEIHELSSTVVNSDSYMEKKLKKIFSELKLKNIAITPIIRKSNNQLTESTAMQSMKAPPLLNNLGITEILLNPTINTKDTISGVLTKKPLNKSFKQSQSQSISSVKFDKNINIIKLNCESPEIIETVNKPNPSPALLNVIPTVITQSLPKQSVVSCEINNNIKHMKINAVKLDENKIKKINNIINVKSPSDIILSKPIEPINDGSSEQKNLSITTQSIYTSSNLCAKKRGQIKLINQPQTKSQNPLDSSTYLDISTDANMNLPSISVVSTQNKINIDSSITNNKPPPINPLCEKRKLSNKPQINHNTIKMKQKKKRLNNNKQKKKKKKHQKNKKISIINKKNKNNLNNKKKQLIRFKTDEKENKNQLIKFKNDEIENYIIKYKFTDDQYDDWGDYKKNIQNINAKEYYELLNGKITETLIHEWFDSYHPSSLIN